MVRLVNVGGGDTELITELIGRLNRKPKFRADLAKMRVIKYGDSPVHPDGSTPCGFYDGFGVMTIATRHSRSEVFDTLLHELGHGVGNYWLGSGENFAENYAESFDDYPGDAELEPAKPEQVSRPNPTPTRSRPMALFPMLNPIAQPAESEQPNHQAISTASNFSPLVQELLNSNPYQADLGITDPTLDAANQVMAQRVGEVATVEETDKLLSELIKLDQRELAAKTSLHKNLAEHQQFVAKNANLLQAVNQSHLLAMSGHRQTQATQAAAVNGLIAARSAIANRMRGAS